MQNYREKIIAVFAFLGGIYFVLEFLLPAKLSTPLGIIEIGKYHAQISDGFIVVGSMAFGLGIINLLLIHGRRILRLRRDWFFSTVLLVSMFLMIALGLFEWISFEYLNKSVTEYRTLANFGKKIISEYQLEKTPTVRKNKIKLLIEAIRRKLERESLDKNKILNDRLIKKYNHTLIKLRSEVDNLEARITAGLVSDRELERLITALMFFASAKYEASKEVYDSTIPKKLYDFMYEGFFVPLGSAMFALLGFYIISAGYRAFRVKNLDSAVMMIVAVLVMLGQIPFYIWISEDLPTIREWLLQVPSAGAFRAIKFGVSIATLFMAMRMWLSIESTSFSRKESEDK